MISCTSIFHEPIQWISEQSLCRTILDHLFGTFAKFSEKLKFLTYPLIHKHRFFWHRCFPVNFAKFLSTPFLQNTSGRLLLYLPGHRQSKYPKLENYLKKSFLGTKHLQNLLLAKYLISVSATLILSVTLLRKIVLE